MFIFAANHGTGVNMLKSKTSRRRTKAEVEADKEKKALKEVEETEMLERMEILESELALAKE